MTTTETKSGFTISLNPSLKHAKAWMTEKEERERMLRSLSVRQKGLTPDRLVHDGTQGQHFHCNYLTYLEQCWSSHRTPVITPDILWFTCLNEIASVVADNAEALRELFTFSSKKTELLVESDSLTVLPVKTVVAHLREFVPIGIDQFLPVFSTSTPESKLAFAAAFCDAVSPYYSYGMYCCGFPAIEVLGKPEDYYKIANLWRGLPVPFMKVCAEYAHTILELLDRIADSIISQDKDFWSDMFTAKKCGSGSQVEIDGWFTKLFRKGHEGPAFPSSFAPHVAKVDYKQVQTQRSFTMFQGLFSSRLSEDHVATPSFGSVIFETTP